MGSDTVKQIEFLSRALKAPRIRDAAARLADQPATPAGHTRNASPRSWTAKSLHATPRARSCASARPGFLCGRLSMTSSSTTSPR